MLNYRTFKKCIFIALISLFVLISCVPEQTDIPVVTQPLLLTRLTSTPTLTPTHQQTNTPVQATNTVIPPPLPTATPTSSPTSYVKFTYSPIWKSSDECDTIYKAFWENNDYFYYLIGGCDQPLVWIGYDLTTSTAVTTTLPLYQYDRAIWEKLDNHSPNITEELLGTVSPSGKHAIYYVVLSEDPLKVEWWVTETNLMHKVKILEAGQGRIWHAVWINNETKVVFDFGYEYGEDLYMADLIKGVTSPLNATSMDFYWSVSPDETMIAYTDLENLIWILPINGGETKSIGDEGIFPQWSIDNESIYYWSIEKYEGEGDLRIYDLDSGKYTTIINYLTLKDAGAWNSYYFSISPDEDKFLTWGDEELWLITITK